MSLFSHLPISSLMFLSLSLLEDSDAVSSSDREDWFSSHT